MKQTLTGIKDSLIYLFLKPVYKFYEKWLWRQIRDKPMPVHVGIIPDGNRRWAASLGLDKKEGHNKGYERVREVLDWIWELGIKVVTIYAMSKENCCRREESERKHLFELIKQGFEELLKDERIYKRKVKVRVIGRLDMVPQDVREAARRVEKATRQHNERILYIAVCYGGRDEIIDATKKIAIDYKEERIRLEDFDENLFSKYLYTAEAPDPDLIIRTSGEERISNFLLWQSAYSELYFADVYWPEFRKIDLWRAIRSYQKRERRFGG